LRESPPSLGPSAVVFVQKKREGKLVGRTAEAPEEFGCNDQICALVAEFLDYASP
jgi:hypothetical protein